MGCGALPREQREGGGRQEARGIIPGTGSFLLALTVRFTGVFFFSCALE